MRNLKLLFVDVETTGKNPEVNGIWQIAIMIDINGKLIEQFDFKICPFPDCIYEEEALGVNNMTIEKIRSFPSESAIFTLIQERLKKYINANDNKDRYFIVGYNVIFDKNFLWEFYKRNGGIPGFIFWGNPIDCMSLASQKLLFERCNMVDFKLGTVTKQLGIEFNRADLHDAMVDIALTRQMYYTILKSEAKIEEAKTTMLNTVTVSPTGEKLEKKKYIKFLDQIIDIGKYKNNPISYIMQNDPQYIIWLSENVKFMEIDHLIIAQAKEEIEWRKATAVNKQEQSFINKYNPSYKSYQSSEEPPLNINTTDGYTDDDLPF